jgi:peptide/nickel transport system ATP-binding protein
MVKTMAETILTLESVSKHFPVKSFRRYGEVVHAMDDISFSLMKGEVLALVGESGSGKTTTASVIARLYSVTSGEIKMANENDPGRLDSVSGKLNRREMLLYRKKVQMIFQDPFGSLNPTHTIEHILSRPFLIHGMITKKDRKESKKALLRDRLSALLGSVGLEPPEQYLRKFPHELSGGQRQRVSIARTFSIEPEIVLADEPTSMLDVSIRMSIMNMMLSFQEKRQVSYLYITHDLAGARYMAQRIIVMYAGMIMEIGTSDEVVQNAAHPYTQLLRSAAPAPEEGLGRNRLITQGDIPSLIHPPSGCRFHPRCPFVLPECSKAVPPLKAIREGHYIRCYL